MSSEKEVEIGTIIVYIYSKPEYECVNKVVSLLVEKRANVEHRAKTGLTPLMEAASGGYVEVARVLLERGGADVNAAPAPQTKETALTIAAERGHCRFVQLLLDYGANMEAKNKKGNKLTHINIFKVNLI